MSLARRDEERSAYSFWCRLVEGCVSRERGRELNTFCPLCHLEVRLTAQPRPSSLPVDGARFVRNCDTSQSGGTRFLSREGGIRWLRSSNVER